MNEEILKLLQEFVDLYSRSTFPHWIWLIIIQVFTITIPLIYLVYDRHREKRSKEKREAELFFSELKDISRHVVKGYKVLKRIDTENGKPSSTHFKKLKITDSSIIFSEKTYRDLNEETCSKLSHCKIKFRNFNKDTQTVIDYIESTTGTNYKKEILNEYIEYLKKGSIGLLIKIEEVHENMPKVNISKLIEEGEDTSIHIIYH